MVPKTPQSERELRKLISGAEPAGVDRYLMIARPNAAYIRGTGILDLRQFAQGFGRHLIDRPDVPDMSVYVTLDEYLPPRLEDLYGPAGAFGAKFVLRQYPKEDLLVALALLNRIRHQTDALALLEAAYLDTWQPSPRAKLEGLLHGPEGRHLVARQTILQAAKEVLLHGRDGATQPLMPLLSAAVMLTHSVATDMAGVAEDGRELWKGMPEDVLMEVVCNAAFNVNDDAFSVLDHAYRVWIEHGQTATKPATRLAFNELVSEALGIDMRLTMLLGWALYHLTDTWQLGGPPLVPRNIVDGAPPEAIGRFLAHCSATPEELAADLSGHPSRWGFLPFEQHPVINLGESLLVLDQDFLLRRVTTGLYWAVADLEKRRGGDKARQAWSIAHGQATEAAIRDQIESLKPDLPLIGTISRCEAYFTDADISVAYPSGKRGHTRKQCDAAVYAGGDDWITFEVVTRQLQVPTRQGAELTKFRDDTAKMVLEKLEQLWETSSCIVADNGKALLRWAPPRARVQPILVQGGAFPIHPATVAFIEAEMSKAPGWKDPRIAKPLILHVDEVEALEAEAEEAGDVLKLLQHWQASNRRAGPLKNYLIATGNVRRPRRLSSERLRAILSDLVGAAAEVA